MLFLNRFESFGKDIRPVEGSNLVKTNVVSCTKNMVKSVFGRAKGDFPPEDSPTSKLSYRTKACLLGRLVMSLVWPLRLRS